ncbi:ATP-dependent 6-phosphofructokinase [Alteromonas hispanica]|uniref:6-phosphofructokinase n=1 Tax=Alteromonas hispanica TaxID=315421 RepID=A0A6L9MPA8_9ALTE|nr:ATP-dependent 6-phosphofructokinase [Alteromonas hispanica]
MSKRVAVLTSGGDAPGMNACIRAIVIACQKSGYEPIGYLHGYNGLLNQEFVSLSLDSTHNLIQQGGTILHSARCKEFTEEAGVKKAAANLVEAGIDALLVIGGDGSFKGATYLSDYFHGQIIGIPGTIDNDIAGTDATIGYYTAIDTAMSSIDKVRDTADAFERIFLVEVMGRHAGFLALNAALSSAADYVILPEHFESTDAELKNIITQIHAQRRLKGSVSFIVVVAENVWPKGLPALTEALNEAGITDVRPLTLGHVQRGGAPVSSDRLLATTLGEFAVSLVGTSSNNVMVGEVNSHPVTVPLDKTSDSKPLNSAQVALMKTIMNERYDC